MAKEEASIEEQFQFYQQQLQGVLIQKEGLKLQTIEIERALEELEKTNQKSAYKIIGGVMVSRPVEKLKEELKETKEDAELRIKSLEKTEERITNKLKELQAAAGGG
jgi:prefoldin beta subunit